MQTIAVNNPRASYFVGGGEIVSMEHARHLAQRGIKVYFFTINPKSVQLQYSQQYVRFKNAYRDKITFVEISMEDRADKVYLSLHHKTKHRWFNEAMLYNRGLYSAIEKTNIVFDVLLSCFNLDALVIPSGKVKRNVVYLSGVPEEESMFRTTFLAMYDKVLAITDEVRDYWQKYSSVPIQVVHTGVDAVRFCPAKDNASELFRIIFIGRLIERKGCDLLLHAVAQLPKQMLHSLDVCIVGDGTQREDLELLTKQLKISNVVRFVGESGTPQKYFQNADMAVFPSRYGEGLQGVVLEAMASGICVVASATSVNEFLLGHGRGMLVEPENINGIKDNIMISLKKREICKNMGKKARSFIEQNYTWNIVIGKLLEAMQ